MTGQTAVITGANRGLGLELTRQLLGAGANVIATARDPQAAVDLRALQVRIEPLDVTDDGSARRLGERLGDLGIDLLINNAGIGEAGPGVAGLDISDLRRTLDVNSLGPMRVTQALLPNLRRGKGRKIVHISSQMGSVGGNIEGGYYGYRASKAALNMLNRSLAAELAGQAFVCVVLHPGWVRTRMGTNRAPLSPRDSVRGLLEVISGLTREDNGRFFDYTGAEIPW